MSGIQETWAVFHVVPSHFCLEASPLASAISLPRFIPSAAQECHGDLRHSFSEHLLNNRFILARVSRYKIKLL